MAFVEKKIKQILISFNIEFEETKHEAVYTSRQAAHVRGQAEDAGIKSMVFKTKEGKFVLVLNPGNKKVDVHKIANIENSKSLFLANQDDVRKLTGVLIGCIPPFGHKTKIKTYLNEKLLKLEYLYFNPGIHTETIRIRSTDLFKLLENPIVYK